MRILSVRLSVYYCLSVRLSVKRVHCDNTEERSIQVFTALHVMQPRYGEGISVCLSVCLSVTRVDCGKTVERSVQIYIPYERTFILVF